MISDYNGLPLSNQDIVTFLEDEFPGGQHLEGEGKTGAMNQARGFRRYLEQLDADTAFWSTAKFAPLGSLFEAIVSANARERKGKGKNPVLTGSYKGVDYTNPRDYLAKAQDVVRQEIFRKSKISFPNLAGNEGCDESIQDELEKAGIPIVEGGQRGGEVPASLSGQLGPFTFNRLWYYWSVQGPVPLEIAKTLYEHPVGKRDVRVAGHCGCPPPEEWVRITDADGKRVFLDPDGSKEIEFTEEFPEAYEGVDYRFVKDLSEVPDAAATIDSYHIDTPQGLKLFADAVRDIAQK